MIFPSSKKSANQLSKQLQRLPILGIRAVQAGALTSEMDRKPHESGRDIKDFEDYERAEPFRNLAAEWQITPSVLAYRYARGKSWLGVRTGPRCFKNNNPSGKR